MAGMSESDAHRLRRPGPTLTQHGVHPSHCTPPFSAKKTRLQIQHAYISYYGRTYAEGKKIGWRDGFRAIYCILKYGLFKQ